MSGSFTFKSNLKFVIFELSHATELHEILKKIGRKTSPRISTSFILIPPHVVFHRTIKTQRAAKQIKELYFK